MPKLLRNAVVKGPFEADEPTHLTKINTDPTAPMFIPDGSRVAGNYVTLEYVCLRCHADRNKAWAASNTRGIHSLGK